LRVLETLTTIPIKLDPSLRFREPVFGAALVGLFRGLAVLSGRATDVHHRGWILVVWECDTRDDMRLREVLAAFLGGLWIPSES
jgi:hypothetical protein